MNPNSGVLSEINSAASDAAASPIPASAADATTVSATPSGSTRCHGTISAMASKIAPNPFNRNRVPIVGTTE
jgi:hypothetical protein